MPLQISEFSGLGFDTSGRDVQSPAGSPLRVSSPDFTGTYVVGNKAQIVRFVGPGSVLWETSENAEEFEDPEYRRLAPGTAFVVA